MVKTLKPDLMVTDIVMPEMEGIGAILEARRCSPATKVIAISGGGHYGRSQNFLVWAHELGADEVLAKPFRMSSLIMAARVVLDRPPLTPPGEDAEPHIPELERLAANR
jgi:DNA-binding response OmpR family regulator